MKRERRPVWRWLIDALLSGLLLTALMPRSRAVTIEGITPSGVFKTVQLQENGRFNIQATTDTLIHVYVDTGVVTVRQEGGVSWSVTLSTTGTPLPSSGTVANTGSVIMTADAKRRQTIICNDSDLTSTNGTIYVTACPAISSGPASVGFPLRQGFCYAPDGPASFQGALCGFSTTTYTIPYDAQGHD